MCTHLWNATRNFDVKGWNILRGRQAIKSRSSCRTNGQSFFIRDPIEVKIKVRNIIYSHGFMSVWVPVNKHMFVEECAFVLREEQYILSGFLRQVFQCFVRKVD